MLRRLRPIIAIFIFALFFALTPALVKADTTDTSDTLPALDSAYSQNSGLDKDLQEFCAKRQGNQMNLETWYSGKCTDDTFSGDGVGFGDIVILDLAEKVSGKKDPTQTFSKTLKSIFTTLKSQSYNSEADKKIALDTARQQLFNSQNSGLIGDSSKIIGLAFQYQPASTQSYLAYISQNLQRHKIIPQALAASSGVGFNTFAPFLTIWTASRNLAYLGLVAFFIIYGFMMMFRVNLGQKTVITVQLAIPKLIVTLLIITFSYAIVGLIYDLMWVVIYFILGYLTTQGLIQEGTWKPVTTAAGMGSLGMVGSFIINMVASIPASFLGITNLVLGKIGTIIAGTTIAVVSILGGGFFNVIIMLILLIAVLISYVKLIIKLIGSFISVVISLVTGPIVLLGNAFPGSNAIGTWLRSIFANLMVFPITSILLLFSYLLMVQPLIGTCNDIANFVSFFGLSDTCQVLFGVKDLVPSGSTITSIPLITPLGGFDTRDLLALIGVGLLLMSAKYVDIVKDALKVPPFKYGTDIANALKSGWTGAGMVSPTVGNSDWYKTASGVVGAKPGTPAFGKTQPKSDTPASGPTAS